MVDPRNGLSRRQGTQLLLHVAEQLGVRGQRLGAVVPETSRPRRILLLMHLGERVPVDRTVPEAMEQISRSVESP